jgi:DNA polymerase III epsilon subunit-like protein
MFLPGHYRMLCTVQRAIWLFQEEPQRKPPKDFKLLTLCRYFDVRLTEAEAHDALNDVRATVELYKAMTGLGKEASATVGTKSRRLPVETPQPRNGWGRAPQAQRQAVDRRFANS